MAAPAHRRNDDGTWDSICVGCFRTIGHGKSESELKEQEQQHREVCIPLRFLHQAECFWPREDKKRGTA